MSMFFALKHQDLVELLTDGGAWNEDGTLADIVTKVWASPHVSLAVTGRARRHHLLSMNHIIQRLAECGSFDRTMEMLQEVLDRCASMAATQPMDDVPLQAAIVGWSETEGPAIRYFNSANGAQPGAAELEPWKLFDVGSALNGMVYLKPEHLAARGITNAMLASDTFLADHGADLFEAGRLEMPSMWGTETRFVHIAGHCDLTTVTADGAWTRRLRTWPDRIGERVQPYDARPTTAGMSRQQRRAAEREARRGRSA